MRHELKHQINLREDLVLSQRLQKLFPTTKTPGRTVHTGSPACTLTRPMTAPCGRKSTGSTGGKNSACGITGRIPPFIRLEKKYKINGLCGKRSARMTQEQVKELLSGSSEFLLDSGEPLSSSFTAKSKGKVCGRRPSSVTTGRLFSMRPAMCVSR